MSSRSALFVPLSVGVLLVGVFYTYAAAFLAPYPGLVLDPSWVINDILPCQATAEWCQANENKLLIGDQILQIGRLTFEQTRLDRRLAAFEGYEPGQTVPIMLRRGGKELTVDWRMLGPTWDTQFERLSILYVFIHFWIAGTVVWFYFRPRDRRWRLFILSNYLTAIWFATGLFSSLHVGFFVACAARRQLVDYSGNLRFASYDPQTHISGLATHSSAAFLHRGGHSRNSRIVSDLARRLYSVGLFVAISGSLVLLAYHLLRSSSSADMLVARIICVGIGVSALPGVVFAAFPAILKTTLYGTPVPFIAIFAVPFLPYVYTYALYKHQFGSLENSAHRLLSISGSVLIYVTAYIVLYFVGIHWLALPTGTLEFSLALSTVLVTAALTVSPHFQYLVDRLAYGVKHSYYMILWGILPIAFRRPLAVTHSSNC